MHVWRTFLAGAFLGAGALGAVLPAFGISRTIIHAATFLPALTVGDVVELVGTFSAGAITAAVVSRSKRLAKRGPG